MIDLGPITREDAGRLLVGVRERRRKLQKGLDKFKDNFDPVLGKNMKEGFEAYSALERRIKEKMNAEENDNPRRAGRNPQEREARHQ